MAMLTGVEVDDLDGEKGTAQGYKSLLSGPKPDHHHFSTSEEEQDFLSEKLPGVPSHDPGGRELENDAPACGIRDRPPRSSNLGFRRIAIVSRLG